MSKTAQIVAAARMMLTRCSKSVLYEAVIKDLPRKCLEHKTFPNGIPDNLGDLNDNNREMCTPRLQLRTGGRQQTLQHRLCRCKCRYKTDLSMPTLGLPE